MQYETQKNTANEIRSAGHIIELYTRVIYLDVVNPLERSALSLQLQKNAEKIFYNSQIPFGYSGIRQIM